RLRFWLWAAHCTTHVLAGAQRQPERNRRKTKVSRRNAALPFILVTIVIDVQGIGLLIPVLPELVTELAGGDLSRGSSYYGWFIAVYAGMQFLFAPVLGGLSDRYGRRNVLLISLFGSGVDYLLMALARSEEHTSELQSRENLVC